MSEIGEGRGAVYERALKENFSFTSEDKPVLFQLFTEH